MRIVVDTSAIAAILFSEAEREPFATMLARYDTVISAGTLIELLRVVQLRFGSIGFDEVSRLVANSQTKIMPVDEQQVTIAKDGMARFGTGRGEPPAVLNFGDLFAYALAKQLSLPLLFKGQDFLATDITPAATT